MGQQAKMVGVADQGSHHHPRAPGTVFEPGPRSTTPVSRQLRRTPRDGTQLGSILHAGFDRPRTDSVGVRLAGELDAATAPQVWDLVRPHLSAGTLRTVVLDLSQLTFISSAGLGVLIDARTHARSANISLRLITGSRCVDRVLEVTGLSRDFACFTDVQTALA